MENYLLLLHFKMYTIYFFSLGSDFSNLYAMLELVYIVFMRKLVIPVSRSFVHICIAYLSVLMNICILPTCVTVITVRPLIFLFI
jgi:hypothetical protein